MASETLYCMECVEGRPVALGLCADCLAGEPLEEVIRQIARLTRELEAAWERERHRERQRDAAEAEVQRLRAALLAVRECANLATARRISGEALYTTSEGDSRLDVETRWGLAAEERCALAKDTEVSDAE